MKKFYTLIFLFLFSLTLQAQTYVLRAENFEDTTAIAASLNDTSQTVSGPNRWIINKEYVGQPTYPNTPRQDSTYFGQIYNAPYSRYLHIYDSTAAFVTSQAIVNGNYDPTVASDNFVIVDVNGVCTMGMDTVIVSFFYTCEGSPDAYAELYYSRNGTGGPWFQVGLPKYNNKPKWQFEELIDPGFVNATDLVFGFRWVNNNGSLPAATSFSMDDFLISGHASPIQTSINFTTIINDTMCIGHYLIMFFSLSDTLCDGWYQVLMSDLTGNFIMPTLLGAFPINSPQTTGGLAIFLDNSLFPGDCYRFTFQRISPAYPPIFIDTTICIKLEWCPDTIETLGPPAVLLDPLDSNSVCAGSVIDVKFFSKGTFDITNYYKLQLSDVNGNFLPPDSAGAIIIASRLSNITYDPANPTPGNFPPGIMAGLIPDTMSPGCNYYIRVVATNSILPPPMVIGSKWGPFCIKHCDIITNDEQDLVNGGLCLLDAPICTTMTVDVNFYDSTTTYNPGNQFMVQVLSSGAPFSPPPMTQVGPLGCLGKVFATGDTTLQFCIGPLDSMITWGIMPNTLYYLRIVATSPSNPANAYGSLIRFQYSFKWSYAPILQVIDNATLQPVTHACIGQVLRFVITNPPPPILWPYTYFYWSGGFVGSPFIRPYNQFPYLSIIFTGGGNFTFAVTCREYGSPGCVSPATTVSVLVYGPPSVAIIPGTTTVCVGKKVTYHTNLFGETYYTWNTYSPHVIMSDTANNYASFTFDSVGTYQISVYGSNPCFDTIGYRTITVINPPTADAGPDSVAICTGSQVTLVTSPIQSGWTFSWKLGSGATLGTNDSLIQSPTTNTEYFIHVTNPGCTVKDSITVTVEQPPQSSFPDTVCVEGHTITLDPGPVGTYYTWQDDTSLHTQQHTVDTPGTYTVFINVTGEVCHRIYNYNIGPAYPPLTSFSDMVCVDGTPIALDPGNIGTYYTWQDDTSIHTQQHTITDTGTYAVHIEVTGEICHRIYTYTVGYAYPDSAAQDLLLCYGDPMTLDAGQTGATYLWNTGATTEQITITSPGTYWVDITTSGQRCAFTSMFTAYDDPDLCPRDFKLPNVFTPNGDKYNEFFHALTYGNYNQFLIKIFNRWGELVFESTDQYFQWDGKNPDGKECTAGVYYYLGNLVHPEDTRTLHGFVTLIR